MAAASAGYDKGVGLPGIQSPEWIYGTGIDSGGVKIDEYDPSEPTSLRKMQSVAEAHLRMSLANDRDEAKHAPDQIAHWQALAREQKPGQTASQILADEQKKLEDLRFALKVSGISKVPVDNAFSLRHGNQFEGGYLDATDHRIRWLRGTLSAPQSDTLDEAGRQLGFFLSQYTPRLATQVPAGPGVCTPFGFSKESGQSERSVDVSVTFRSLQYPNLLFRLDTSTAYTGSRRNIRDMPKMGFDESGVFHDHTTQTFGPKAVDILGSPGRILGSETPQSCADKSLDDCDPPEDLYKMSAATFGEVGRLDSPYLLLNMAAVVPDDYKLKRDSARAEDSDARAEYVKQRRAGLNGHQPPPFKEGIALFEQIVRSIRVRPNGIAGSNVVDMPSPIPAEPGASH